MTDTQELTSLYAPEHTLIFIPSRKLSRLDDTIIWLYFSCRYLHTVRIMAQ